MATKEEWAASWGEANTTMRDLHVRGDGSFCVCNVEGCVVDDIVNKIFDVRTEKERVEQHCIDMGEASRKDNDALRVELEKTRAREEALTGERNALRAALTETSLTVDELSDFRLRVHQLETWTLGHGPEIEANGVIAREAREKANLLAGDPVNEMKLPQLFSRVDAVEARCADVDNWRVSAARTFDRLNWLENNLPRMAEERLARLEDGQLLGRVGALEDWVKQEREKVPSVLLTTDGTSIADLEFSLKGAHERLNHFDDDKFPSVLNRLHGLESRHDRLDTQATGHHQRIDRLEAGHHMHGESIELVQARAESLLHQVESLEHWTRENEPKIDDLDHRLHAVEERHAEENERIALQPGPTMLFSELSRRVGDLEEWVNPLRDRIKINEGAPAAFTTLQCRGCGNVFGVPVEPVKLRGVRVESCEKCAGERNKNEDEERGRQHVKDHADQFLPAGRAADVFGSERIIHNMLDLVAKSHGSGFSTETMASAVCRVDLALQRWVKCELERSRLELALREKGESRLAADQAAMTALVSTRATERIQGLEQELRHKGTQYATERAVTKRLHEDEVQDLRDALRASQENERKQAEAIVELRADEKHFIERLGKMRDGYIEALWRLGNLLFVEDRVKLCSCERCEESRNWVRDQMVGRTANDTWEMWRDRVLLIDRRGVIVKLRPEEIQARMDLADGKTAIELLEDVVNQACQVAGSSDGGVRYDSMALSTYADALRFLHKLGRVVITAEQGRRVLAERKGRSLPRE
jgi:hypothetical protein